MIFSILEIIFYCFELKAYLCCKTFKYKAMTAGNCVDVVEKKEDKNLKIRYHK